MVALSRRERTSGTELNTLKYSLEIGSLADPGRSWTAGGVMAPTPVITSEAASTRVFEYSN